MNRERNAVIFCEQRKEHNMIIKKISFILGILCLGYFFLYAALTGLTNTFTYVWLLMGSFFLLIAVFYKRVKKWVKALPKWIRILGVGIAGICILSVLAAEILCISYGMKTPEPGADYVIVLGAQVRGRTPSYNLARRLDVAYDYLVENPDTIAILSGGKGSGENISEAQAMMEYLLERGIEPERMILEDQSTNTDENIRFSREKMESEEARVVLATNQFHVFRSIGIARKQGLTHVEGLGAGVMWFTVPNLYLREAIAIIKYAVCRQI